MVALVCWLVWSGSRLACLPLAFICLPLLFICLPVLFICLPGCACGRVPGWLVSHFLSFVSHFFSFVSQGLGVSCFKEWSHWCSHGSGSRPACLPLPFICLPLLFICLPGWVLVVGFPAGLSPTSFHLSPTSFHLSPSSFHLSLLVVGFPAGLSPTSFHLSPTSFHLSPSSFHLSPRLGACGRVPGWLVSHFLSFVSHFFSFVSQFFSFVSQAGCLWSGSRLACLPLPFICLPLLFICQAGLVGAAACSHGLACLPLLSFSHFFSFVSQFFSFVSQAGCLWSGLRLACLPLLFILSPTSFHLSPRLSHFPLASFSRYFICLPGWVLDGRPFPAGLVSQHFFSFVSQVWSLAGVSPCIFVSHFLSFVSHFYSFVSQPARLGGVRPFPSGHHPISVQSPRSVTGGVRPFSRWRCHLSPTSLFICLPGWVLWSGFTAGLSPTFHLSSHFFSFVPGSVTAGCPPFCLPHFFHLSPICLCGHFRCFYSFVSHVCHFFSLPQTVYC